VQPQSKTIALSLVVVVAVVVEQVIHQTREALIGVAAVVAVLVITPEQVEQDLMVAHLEQ
jgi:hypothetical protein